MINNCLKNLPVISNLKIKELELTKPATFIVEKTAGKSTLVEGIAVKDGI